MGEGPVTTNLRGGECSLYCGGAVRAVPGVAGAVVGSGMLQSMGYLVEGRKTKKKIKRWRHTL